MSSPTPSPPTPFVRTLRGTRDLAAYGHFLLSLDAETRRQRFCGHLSDEALLAHVTRVASLPSVLLGAFEAGHLVGVAELVPAGTRFMAEAAFVVASGHQGQGVGTALLDRTLLAAANRGIGQVRVACLPANFAMRRLAAKAHGSVALTVDEVEGTIATARPSLFSLWREQMGESAARFAEWARPAPRRS